MKKILTISALSVACALLQGCGSMKVYEDASHANKQITGKRSEMISSILDAEQYRIAAQEVARPYIAGNSKPLSREVSLPDVLRRPTPVTALYSSMPVDLATAAQQLSDAAKITINVTSDALLPPAAFAQKSGATGGATTNAAPTRVLLRVQSQPLWQVLDDVARQASVSWRPVPGGAEFYRLETRIIYLSAIPPTANVSASLGKNGGANSAFEARSKTSFETKDQNVLKGIFSTVDALITKGGKVVVSSENQTLIVTDTVESLNRVEEFVKQQNKMMSARVRVLVEAIEVVDKDNSEIGVDWNNIFATASGVLSGNAPTTLNGIASASYQWQNREGTASLVIKALNDVGTVVNRRSFPFLTTSGRPVTQAIRSTFNYVDQVSAPNQGNTLLTTQVAPTITQKDETVGTFITMVPTAKPDGTVFLSVSYDVTSAQPLVPFTAGGITVQQKTIDGQGVIQEVPIRSGQTVVIGGIETQTSQNTARRMAPGLPMLLGGSDATKLLRSRMVLLVTAVVEEGV